MNWIRPSAQQSSSQQQPQQPVAGSGAAAATSGRMVTVPHYNLWRDGQAFNLDVYVSAFDDFSEIPDKKAALIWSQQALRYDWSDSNERQANVSVPITPHMLNNGSVWAHCFFTMAGYPHDPDAKRYTPAAVIYKLEPLNVYRPKPKLNVRKNLVTGEYVDERVVKEMEAASIVDDAERAKMIQVMKSQPLEWVSFWQPSLHLRLLHDMTAYPRGGIPAPIAPHVRIDPDTQGYFPPVYVDHFWSLKSKRIAINESVTELPLALAFSPISMWKWMLQLSITQSWKQQEEWGAAREGESDEIKRMLTETDPWLLGLTAVVSLLHSVFDFLAFKNDIAFWRSNKSVEGISVRTIFINTGSQLVIFLYLLDNETSYMILISAGVGLLIEAWKINRAADVSFGWRGRVPWISVKDKASYTRGKTAEYDAEAMRYLSYAFYPLAIGYAIYALFYREFTSWYSWVLSSAVSFIYMFGFITMCPQLYLNYKLKSVAHLPWRMLTYKFFNTFIDDLFAFIIKMPTLHRIAVFRDDVVFFVYLYQRWKYPVDMKRENEFGLMPVAEDEAKVEQPAAAAVAAAALAAEGNQADQAPAAESEDQAQASPASSTVRQRAHAKK